MYDEGYEPHERFSAEQDKPEYIYSSAAGTAATAIIVYIQSTIKKPRDDENTKYIYKICVIWERKKTSLSVRITIYCQRTIYISNYIT